MSKIEEKNFLESLNPEQKEAVLYNDGPLLIVAGAGTGKTHLVTSKIAHLILNENYTSDSILALTFTEKAAGEMEDRVLKLLPYGYVDLWIHTFHAFAERILREHALKLSLSPDFRVLTENQTWLLFYQHLDEFELKEFYNLANPRAHIKDLITYFGHLKDELISPEDYNDWVQDLLLNRENIDYLKHKIILTEKEKKIDDINALFEEKINRYEELAKAYARYQNLLRQNNAIDFADMVFYVYKLFKENPLVLQEYQNQFQYVIIDEFQDTNYGQYELIKLLVEKHKRITVVGDDDQSIYRFRGASIFNILEFKNDYPEAKEVVLVKNYRSAQGILDLAYKSIQHNNPYRLEEKLNLNKKLQAVRDIEAKIELLEFEHFEDELNFVVEKIQELSKQDGFQWKDIAILSRKNNSLEEMAGLLEASSIPFQVLSGKGLYKKEVILNIISYFRLLDNYKESSAFTRLLTLPVFNLETETILTLSSLANSEKISLYEASKRVYSLDVKEEDRYTIEKILILLEKHSKLALKASVIDVFLAFLKDYQYLDYLMTDLDEYKEAQLWYLQLFIEKLKDFEANYIDSSLKSFMEIFELELESGDTGNLRVNPNSGPDFVNLLTIHGSKGLEFKYLFLIDLVDSAIPGRNKGEKILLPEALLKEHDDQMSNLESKDLHLQEERRLFYVALTRAKDALFLTYSKKKQHLKSESKVSRFIAELDMEAKNFAEIKSNLKNIIAFRNAYADWNLNPDLYTKVSQQFSFSKLRDYDTCPKKFFYKYILKIPVHERSIALDFGSMIHNIFYQFLKEHKEQSDKEQLALFATVSNEENKQLNREFLENLLKERWPNLLFESDYQENKYKEEAKKILDAFYNEYKNSNIEVKDLERKVKVKLKDLDIVLEARFDRVDYIDKESGAYKIIDYKTGKKPKSFSSEDKYQLLIYYYLANDLYGIAPQRLEYLYVNKWESKEIVPKEKDLAKLNKWISEIVADVRAKKFPAKASEFNCQYCPYANLCPFSKK